MPAASAAPNKVSSITPEARRMRPFDRTRHALEVDAVVVGDAQHHARSVGRCRTAWRRACPARLARNAKGSPGFSAPSERELRVALVMRSSTDLLKPRSAKMSPRFCPGFTA
jgi:hypothetical protein